MKNNLYTLTILICSSFGVISQSSSSVFEWLQVAGSENKNSSGRSIAVDISGNSYVTGSFQGSVTFGSTTLTTSSGVYDYDIFIAKLDASGNYLWAKQAGGSIDVAIPYSIAVDTSGNSYITGEFDGTANFGSTALTSSGSDDIFIAKLDVNGNFLWAKQAGGNYTDKGTSIVVDDSGNSYVTGNFDFTATFGSFTLTSITSGISPSSVSDIFVAKLDANGNFLWVKQTGGNGYVVTNGISVEGSGNSYITGYFSGTTTFGTITLTSAGQSDVFIAKLDTDGNYLWVERAGGNLEDRGISISVDSSGNSYITGYFQETATFGSFTLTGSGQFLFIVKLDTDGNYLWVKQAGVGSGMSIAVDALGNSYATGYFQGTTSFGSTILTTLGYTDIFVTKLDTSGNFLWAKQAGGSGFDYGQGIAVDTLGNSYVTGYFRGIATFGPFTSTAKGYLDVFITKIKEEILSVDGLEEGSRLTIFPNPANHQFTITGLSGNLIVQIINLNGQILSEVFANGQETIIDTEHLSNGTYIVRVESEKQMINKKIVINK